MNKTLKHYLDKYFDEWTTNRGSLPMVPYDEDVESELFVGEVDEDEYIKWQYQENTKQIDFESLEKKFNLTLPQQLKEYYTSFLFLQLSGFYEGKSIWLNPITDKTNILAELEYMLVNECSDKIEIGILSVVDLPICVDMQTGRVVVWDVEKEKTYELSESLVELFEKMNPTKG